MSEAILQRLDLLAAKLGVATEHLWEVLTKQGFIEGAYGVVLLVAGAGVVLLSIRIGKLAPGFMEDDGPERFVGTILVALVLFALGTVALIIGIGDSKYLFNPEMYALRQILDALP